MSEYPVIGWLIRNRRMVVGASTCIFPLLGFYVTLRTGSPDYIIGGLIIGLAIHILVRSYLELISLISDMLMPK
jgi:membrane associated rhomboid family serine protease